jgi:Domain of unknown function (DUF4345)
MKPGNFALVLKMLAPICIAVGAVHLVFGLRADAMLGARIAAESMLEPTLDSQNRFYGVVFSVYGWLLLMCARDLRRFLPVLYVLLAVFFMGGIARLVSMAIVGLPSVFVLLLAGTELTFPPLLALWLRRLDT